MAWLNEQCQYMIQMMDTIIMLDVYIQELS